MAGGPVIQLKHLDMFEQPSNTENIPATLRRYFPRTRERVKNMMQFPMFRLRRIRTRVREHPTPRLLITMSVSYMFLHTAYNTINIVETSARREPRSEILVISHVSSAFASFVLPTYAMRHLGLKFSQTVAMFAYLTHVVSGIVPMFPINFITSAILGLGTALLFTSTCTYLTHISYDEATDLELTLSATIGRNFGIFYLTFYCSYVFGGMVIQTLVKSIRGTLSPNHYAGACGMSFVLTTDVLTNQEQTLTPEAYENERRFLFLFYFICIAIALMLNTLFLDQLPGDDPIEEGVPQKLMIETARQMVTLKAFLLMPITFYSGLQTVFFLQDYLTAFVACEWGLRMIPFMVVIYGCSASIFALLSGVGQEVVGRVPMAVSATGLQIAMLFSIRAWNPDDNKTAATFFLISIIWGIAEGIWSTTISSYYAEQFKDGVGAAFGTYMLWHSVGAMVGNAWQSVTTFDNKHVFLSFTLIIGLVLYLIAEILIKTEKAEVERQNIYILKLETLQQQVSSEAACEPISVPTPQQTKITKEPSQTIIAQMGRKLIPEKLMSTTTNKQ